MIFITGATGFLGREVLGRLLVANQDEEFCVVVRPSKELSAEKRMRAVLENMFGAEKTSQYLNRVKVIPGDLSLANMGVGETELENLANQTSSVLHCAATTSLGQALEDAREANVASTQNVLKFCDKAAEKNRDSFELHHVSTAYVAGDTNAVVLPSELRPTGSFRNAYEKSKAEAEALVRDAHDRFNVQIYRPSMIVGDSVTGETSAFNVIYIPTRYLAQGICSILPARENTPCDIVPVDYVADAIVALSQQRIKSGHCYHLCSGVGRESTLSEMVELIITFFSAYRKKKKSLLQAPLLVPPETILTLQNAALQGVKHLEARFSRGFRVLKEILHLLPYMASNPQFNTDDTVKALNGVMTEPPLFRDYAEAVFTYCLHTNWGKEEWTNPLELDNWYRRYQLANISA